MTRALALTTLLALASPLFAETAAEVASSTSPVSAIPSVFALEAAKNLRVSVERITALEKRGFGRTEIISLVLISRESPKKWENLVKERERGKKLRDMAREAGLDYNDLFRKSEKMRKDMD